ncbi:MAG: sulfatase [Planctomycetota bacterium]
MRSLVLLSIVSSLLLGCSEERRPNILLISLDTLRADRLGTYGYDRDTSPQLDRFAAAGVVFEDVTSVSPWTLPSHASLLTSLYPSRHGVVSDAHKLPDARQTLTEVLGSAGYATHAIVNAHYLSERYGLLQGFEGSQVVSEWDDPKSKKPKLAKKATQITSDALDWLERRDAERPFFLFLHYYDAHSDYDPSEPYRTQFVRPYAGPADGTTGQLLAYRKAGMVLGEGDIRHLGDLYDAQVRQLDDQIGRLLRGLDSMDLASDTIVAITSDHGEELFEHGSLLHGQTYFQEVIRIPWLMRGPGVPSGTRAREPVSLIDVPVTLLDLVGLDPPKKWQGRSGVSIWRGQEPEPRFLFAEADHGDTIENRRRLVRHGPYKLIHDRETSSDAIFDLRTDPGEERDLSPTPPEITAALRTELERLLRQASEGESIGAPSEATQRLLDQLGYTK